MIYWEEPGASLPTWQATQAMLGTTVQTGSATEDIGDPGYSGNGASENGYTAHTESGRTEDAYGITETGSSSYSFSSSISVEWTFTRTYLAIMGTSLETRTRSLTFSESGTTSQSASYSFGNTTVYASDGYTVATASDAASEESSSSEHQQGETSGGVTNDFGGLYTASGGDSMESDPADGSIFYTMEPSGEPVIGTRLTTTEITASSWETYIDTKTIHTIDDGELTTTTKTVEWHRTVETTLTIDDVVETYETPELWPVDAARDTHIVAERCNQLHEAGSHEGLAHWCDVWTPVEEGVLSPEYDHVTLDSDPYTFETESPGMSYGITIEAGLTTFERVYGTHVVAAGPGSSPGVAIASPRAYGYQHHESLEPGDPVYASYSIAVATSCTDTEERALRSVGQRVLRDGITQVAPLYPDDTVNMTGGTVSPFYAGADHGGHGIAGGDNRMTWQRGVYDYTWHDADGASETGRRTVTEETLSETSPRGRVWHINPQRIDLGGLEAYEPNVYMEMPCAPADL